MPGAAAGTALSAPAAMNGRDVFWRIARALGALVGYGCLAALLYLLAVQIYRWFRDGEWTHFGVNEGIRVGLSHCCVKDGDTGRLAALVHWLDAPVDWLGLHKVLEFVPASLVLFALSILGNSVFIHCCDRLDARNGAHRGYGS